MEQTHSLLKRQLKRHLGDLDSIPKEWQSFLESVNTAYQEFDADRSMLERSLELSSQELLQRNSEMRAVFQAFPDLFFRLDSEGTILDYKAGGTTDLYLPPEKLLGKRIQDIPLKDMGKKFHEGIQQLKETKSLVSIEYSLNIEKQENFYEARLLPLLENQIIVIVRNVTERKKAEKALQESEERLKLVVEGAELGTWDQNMKTGEVIRNRYWAEMLGYTLEEINQHVDAWKALIHPDDLPEVNRVTQDHRAGLTPFLRCEHRMRTKSGEWKWILNCGKIIERDSEGKPLRATGTHADITERKRAEEALKESEKKYSTIVEKGNDGIVIIQDDLIKFANSTIAAMVGIDPEEVMGRPFIDLISPAYREMVFDRYKKRVSGQEPPSRYEIELLSKDGRKIPVEISASLIEYEGRTTDMAIIRDITERKLAEEKLRESEEKYRDLFDNASDLIQSVDEKGKFVYVNKKWKEALGYSDEEIRKLNFTDVIRKDQVPHYMELFKKVVSGETVDNVEVVFVTKGGREIFVSGSVNPRMISGKFVATRAIFRDVTERKRAEELLRTSEAQLSNAMKIAQLGYWEYDVAEDLFTFNDHFYSIFRTSVEKVGGYTMSPARYAQLFVHPDDMEVVGIETRKAIETTDPHYSRQLEHRIIYVDGEIGYIAVRFFIVKDNQGRTIKTYGANQDITERKRAEEALRESESKYRTLVENIPQKIFIKNENLVYVSCNENYAKDLKIKPDEIAGKTDYDFYPKALAEKYRGDDKKTMEAGTTEDIEERYIQDGQEVWVHTIKTPVKDESGNIAGILGIFWDITERKRAEERLRESEEKYRALFESSAEGILVADVETKEFRYANPAMCKMLGYTEEEFKRMSVVDIHPRDALEDVISEFEAQARGEKTLASNVPCLRRDGTVIHADISTAKALIGGRECNVGFFTDITERKRAEEMLRESEEKFRNLADQSPNMIFINKKGRVVYTNSKCEETMGYTKEEFYSSDFDFLILIAPESKELLKENLSKNLKDEDVEPVEYTLITKEGKKIEAILSAKLINYGGEKAILGIITDITERKRAEEALRQTRDHLDNLINYANAPIIVWDPDKRITLFNHAFEYLTGRKADDVIGRPFDILFPDATRDKSLALIDVAASGKYWDAVEIPILRKDGEVRTALWNSANLYADDRTTLVATIAQGQDITERKRAEENLKKAKEEAEEANRLKSEFLANMSHEIRTPMNAIIGMTGITLDTPLTDEQREYLNIVKESSYSLLGLLDDILDLSKIEAGRVELETIDFDLRATVEGVAETLAHRASTKGLELACLIHHEVPIFLWGDPGRLRQVLMNLGGNAIKFTEKGEVVIRADLEEETEDQATLLFSVTDTGVGIPEDKQKKIFESFTQADGSYSRRYGGTGLGLSISKRLVELMGGKIGIESQPGKGSRFWFTSTFEKQKEFKEITPLVPPDIRGIRVLVTDDNETNRTILVKILESFGCSPEAVGSGAEALQVLKRAAHKEKLFDLVLLDMQMPEMDGEETLRAIKDDPKIKDVAVIILTSIGERGDASRLQALGCAGYLLKPVKQSQLFDAIITVLSRSQDAEFAQKTKGKEKPTSIVTRHTIAEQKRRRVRILVAEDNPMNQKLAVTLLKRAGYSVDAVENGRMVLEALNRTAYDLIFMDVQMPEVDGFEATKAIRQMEGDRKHTPIVAMTAHAMKGDRERCLQAGMDDYISKPIEPQELFAVIKRWTKSFEHQNSIPKQEKSKKDDWLKDIPIDLENALLRFDNDKEFFKEMLHEFLNYAPKQLEILCQAAEKNDGTTLEKEAHSIKGAAGNLGATQIANLFLNMEHLARSGDLTGAKEIIRNLIAEFKRLEEYFNNSLSPELSQNLDNVKSSLKG